MTLYLTDNTSASEIERASRIGLRPRGQVLPCRRDHQLRRRRHGARARLPCARRDGARGVVLSLHGEVTDRRRRRVRSRARVRRSRCSRRIVRDFPALARRARAHHHARGRGVRRGGRADRRRDDHAAAPPLVAQRALRGRRAAALVLPADPQARDAPQGAGRRRDVGQPEVLPRHRQRAARAGTRRKTRAAAPAATPRPYALALYAEAFEAAGALDRLEGFASFFGADFYRLPRNRDTVTLVREPWTCRRHSVRRRPRSCRCAPASACRWRARIARGHRGLRGTPRVGCYPTDRSQPDRRCPSFVAGRGKSGLRRAGCRVTPGRYKSPLARSMKARNRATETSRFRRQTEAGETRQPPSGATPSRRTHLATQAARLVRG